MVSGVFLVVQGSCSVVHVHDFMSVFKFFSRFQVVFECKSWFQFSFYSSRSVFHGARSVFIVSQDSRLISHGSSWILPSLMVPGWFKSELSAGGAK